MEIKKTVQFGAHSLTISTGLIAKQATASVVVDMDGTTVLVTVVAEGGIAINRDFFPLKVDYRVMSYAYGKIPGGFFKREGKPPESEVLTARLIDRPIRPLFPEGYKNEIQIIATVLSVNPQISSDIPAMIGASCALNLSGVPFLGPMAAARVGYKDGVYILNPTVAELKESKLDLVVAGTKNSVLMVESEANMLSEEIMLDAVMFGHGQFQLVINAIEELTKEAIAAGVGREKITWQALEQDSDLISKIKDGYVAEIEKAYQNQDKLERQTILKELREKIKTEIISSQTSDQVDNQTDTDLAKNISEITYKLEKNVVRASILDNKPRIDGRDLTTVRNIAVKPGLLSRTHGSALFTRGETQAIVTATLGSTKDAQRLDGPNGEEFDKFMLHYNFPPYSVGEIGMFGIPRRREIGHGKLAKRAISAVLPNSEDFPYTLRIVSETTESNGSSSMAAVCGSSLALMDAGVPIKAAVAGIAMGLIKDGARYSVITDILGDEDHLGDMDFKVAGTRDGITALQMDIKIDGITEDIMQVALTQAKAGRLHILDIMDEAIAQPRTEVSEFAPKIINIKVPVDKIKDVIGKGGAMIRSLTENTDATIDIDETGNIKIAASSPAIGEEIRLKIERLTAEVEVGAVYDGKVAKIVEFGAFVNILPGKDGLVHKSQIANHRVEDVSKELTEGQMIKVKVLELDRQGRIKLSIKEVEGFDSKEKNGDEIELNVGLN